MPWEGGGVKRWKMGEISCVPWKDGGVRRRKMRRDVMRPMRK